MAKITCLPQNLLLGGIRFYRFLLSPWVGRHCRFYPTCSCYAFEAIEKYGAIAGTWLTVKRLLKCHPWHPGGMDEIP
jgi:hypothetical protein